MTQRLSTSNLDGPDDIWLIDRATQTNFLPGETTKTEKEETCEAYCKKQRHINLMQSHGSQTSSAASLTTDTASPVQVPGKRYIHSSVEGLNREIEKLVLYPGPAGRSNRLDQVSSLRDRELSPDSKSTTPVADLLRDSSPGATMTETANRQLLHSDDSNSASPPLFLDEARPYPEASPRMNRFLSQLPPEGCERVLSKTVQTDEMTVVITPVSGFQLRPSEGSAFNRV